MTAAEFFAAYAERSGVDPEWLAAQGRRAYPCHCGDADCPGWAMMPSYLIEEARAAGVPFTMGVLTSELGYAP